MRSIFLGSDVQINRVYPESVKASLEAVAGLERHVYTKEDTEDFSDVEYIFSTWGMPHFTVSEIKSRFPRLKGLFYAAGTVQGFAREFLECGVRVYSAWAANAIPVAEYTVAQIILANKGFFPSQRLASVGKRDEAIKVFSNYKGNFNATIGIIGCGMIGSLVCEMLKAYQLRVLAFDPFLSDERAEALGVLKVSLDELFSRCEVVSNHLANNAQTVGILKGEHFEKMLPYATFINTGRGAQVVEEDLIRVLEARPDLTALLDVTYPEPPEENSPFYRLDNCILTPHIAGSSSDEVHRMAEYMLEEFKNPEKYEVTLKMLETMA